MKKIILLLLLCIVALTSSAQSKDKTELAFDSVSAVSKSVMSGKEVAVTKRSLVYPKSGPQVLCDSLNAWICEKVGSSEHSDISSVVSLASKAATVKLSYDADLYTKTIAAGRKLVSSYSITKTYEDADYVTMEYNAEKAEAEADAPSVEFDAVTFLKSNGHRVGWGLVKGLSQDKILDRIQKGLKEEEGKGNGLLAFLADNDASLALPKRAPYMVDKGVRVTYGVGEYDDEAHTCLIRKIANTFESGGVRYSILSRKSRKCAVTTQREPGPKGSVTIPDVVSSHGLKYKVTSIADGAFADCTKLSSISISEGVKSIGEEAFAGCSALTEVQLPRSLSRLGDGAFRGCSSLQQIEIPEGVSRVAPMTFYDCRALASVSLPQSLKTIGSDAFGRCSALAEITLPEEVEDVDFLAFEACTGLKSVTIQGDETAINFCAFEECDSIAAIYDLSTTPQDISSSTFPTDAIVYVLPGCKMGFMSESNWRNSNIREIQEIEAEGIAYSITSVEDHTCVLTGLDRSIAGSVVVPAVLDYRGLRLSVTEVTPRAFAESPEVTDVELPATVTRIGEEAFAGSRSLKSVKIACDTALIGKYAFRDCIALQSVTIPALVDTLAEGLFAGCSLLSSVALPCGLSAVPDHTFEGCVSLKSIFLPARLTRIGTAAFSGCSALASLQLPDDLEAISAEAFQGCSSLETLTLPSALRTIDSRAFAACSLLTALTLPASITAIGQEAFAECPLLLSVTNLAAEPQEIEADVFSTYGQLHILPDCKKLYAKAKTWKKFRIKKDAVSE